MPVNPRRLVVRALARLERTPGAAGQSILRTMLDGPDARDLELRDRALVTSCFYGILRWRLRLDYHIGTHARKGVPSDPELANILRLGTFQLLFLDRVPARAAVHTSVHLARQLRGPAVSKFVNGVLRAIDRDRTPPTELSTRYGHPNWMVQRLAERMGDALEARLEANMTPPPVHLRVHPDSHDKVAGMTKTDQPDVFTIRDSEVDSEAIRRGIRAGHWLPQDKASVAMVDLLNIDRPALRVLELCCGRGVKTTRLLEKRQSHNDNGLYIASDISIAKLHEAKRLCQRWLPDQTVYFVAADSTKRLPIAPEIQFDRILIDAPCTGLGVIRRRPEILWRRTPNDIDILSKLQWNILRQAIQRLAPGGQLVYSVCTLTDEETTGVITRVLSEYDLALEQQQQYTPENDDSDGFFGAVFTRPA